jgi:hypothetical protein
MNPHLIGPRLLAPYLTDQSHSSLTMSQSGVHGSVSLVHSSFCFAPLVCLAYPQIIRSPPSRFD